MNTVTTRAEDRIKKIVSVSLGVSVADLRSTDHLILDLGDDSLDVAEIVTDIEIAFHIEISDEAAEKFRTVGDLIEHVA